MQHNNSKQNLQISCETVKCNDGFDKQAVCFGLCTYDRQTIIVSEELYLPAPERCKGLKYRTPQNSVIISQASPTYCFLPVSSAS